MSDTVIQVENLGKKYLIRHEKRERYTALRDVLANKFKSFGSKIFSPFTIHHSPFTDSKEDFWALKDVSFEIKQGERVGIIGRNGAGKTTLLKLLSRITEPTTGKITLKGRVASLLEVGTGFHPELTGRENIFLNGAILGMSKVEIKRKFDEIVDFAEIEKFLDTPVKRYSSGMYVRLAFAVAAHLEPEILIVDEVLAVGDAQFQKKCLGKMEDVSNKEGRSVLFVSHNMGAIRSICNRIIFIDKGEVKLDGESSSVISTYLSTGFSREQENDGQIFWTGKNNYLPDTQEICIKGIQLLGLSGKAQSIFEADNPINVVIFYQVKTPMRGMRFNLCILTEEGDIAFLGTDHIYRKETEQIGSYQTTCIIPGGLLNCKKYVVAISCDMPGVKVLLHRKEYLSFTVTGKGNQSSEYQEIWPGVVCPKLEWKISKISSKEYMLN
ncbi:MAG: ABC transporter ATP-binding protein [Ignavibacterium sp.]|nr:ABC transporter ATP-binding protein [Ignavibacterium sp.]